MLEIDKIKERFPEHFGVILAEYARDSLKSSEKDSPPPNSPFRDQSQELLNLPVSKKSKKKG